MAENIKIDLLDLFKPLTPQQFEHYLRLWSWLEITQVEPAVNKHPVAEESADGSDSSGSNSVTGGITRIDLGDGWFLQDHLDKLAVSVGENERTFTTNKIIAAAQKAIEVLQQRGAKAVSVSGVDVGQLAAWYHAHQLGIEVINFEPTLAQNVQIEYIKNLHHRLEELGIKPHPNPG